MKDGRRWPIGDHEVVAWINAGTTITKAITAAIPPLFCAYATVELPRNWQENQGEHDAALLEVLIRHAGSPRWWLGYLDTGADDIVFPDAPRTILYADWKYVLVAAEVEQAARWRHSGRRSFWKGSLPNLMFPRDRSWLISTLWDDDWSCIGGSAALVDDLLALPVLGGRTRSVAVGGDASPPATRHCDRLVRRPMGAPTRGVTTGTLNGHRRNARSMTRSKQCPASVAALSGPLVGDLGPGSVG